MLCIWTVNYVVTCSKCLHFISVIVLCLYIPIRFSYALSCSFVLCIYIYKNIDLYSCVCSVIALHSVFAFVICCDPMAIAAAVYLWLLTLVCGYQLSVLVWIGKLGYMRFCRYCSLLANNDEMAGSWACRLQVVCV